MDAAGGSAGAVLDDLDREGLVIKLDKEVVLDRSAWSLEPSQQNGQASE